jgi:hypothetical protein
MRKLPSMELHNLYSSPNIIRQIKSRRIKWARHVALMGETRHVYKVLVGKPEERYHSEDQGIDGKMESEWILWILSGGGAVEWIHLVQDWDLWRALVNAVKNFGFWHHIVS